MSVLALISFYNLYRAGVNYEMVAHLTLAYYGGPPNPDLNG